MKVRTRVLYRTPLLPLGAYLCLSPPGSDSRRLHESLIITRDLARGERVAAMDARLEQRAGCRRVPTSLIGLYIFHGQ